MIFMNAAFAFVVGLNIAIGVHLTETKGAVSFGLAAGFFTWYVLNAIEGVHRK